MFFCLLKVLSYCIWSSRRHTATKGFNFVYARSIHTPNTMLSLPCTCRIAWKYTLAFSWTSFQWVLASTRDCAFSPVIILIFMNRIIVQLWWEVLQVSDQIEPQALFPSSHGLVMLLISVLFPIHPPYLFFSQWGGPWVGPPLLEPTWVDKLWSSRRAKLENLWIDAAEQNNQHFCTWAVRKFERCM